MPVKTLYLLRHAKSSWEDRSLPDHERPLSPRGCRAAPAMAEHMRDEGLIPDLALVSTATRTRETWELLAPVLGKEVEVEHIRRLYHADPRTLMDEVRGVADEVERLLLVGHNPGIEAFALGLAGEGRPEGIARMRVKYPTAALAVLDFAVDRWEEVEAGTGRLEGFVRPKDLPDAEERGL